MGTPDTAQSVAHAVGQKRLENPSPNWKASTAICLLMLSKSASGIMSGIDVTACPLPEGIKRFIDYQPFLQDDKNGT